MSNKPRSAHEELASLFLNWRGSRTLDGGECVETLRGFADPSTSLGPAFGWILARSTANATIARCVAFLLADKNFGSAEERLPPLLDLSWTPTFNDPATLINLSTATMRLLPQLGDDSRLLLGLAIPHLVEAGFRSVQLVAESMVDLLVYLDEEELTTTLFGPIERAALLGMNPKEQLSTSHQIELASFKEKLQRSRKKASSNFGFASLVGFKETLRRVIPNGDHELPANISIQREAYDRHLREWRLLADTRKADTQVHQLRIVSSTDGETPSFNLVAEIIQLWQLVVASFVSGPSRPPSFWPLGTAAGSFVISLAVDSAPDQLKEALPKASGTGDSLPDLGDSAAWHDLRNALAKAQLKIECAIADPRTAPHQVSFVMAPVNSPAPTRRRGRGRWKRDLRSLDVPQADNIDRVFLVTEIVGSGDIPTAEKLEIEPRQVDYYVRAAICLGLITEQRQLSVAGQRLIGLERDQRKALAAVLFETSNCGGAWVDWAQRESLSDVSPDTASRFLIDTVDGLNKITATRRSKTLIAWHNELMPHHFKRLQETRKSKSPTH